MARVGDILFCGTLLIGVLFRIAQYYSRFLSFLIFEHRDAPMSKRIKRAWENTRCTYMLDFLPPLFLFSAPISITVSATDSEYAGIAVLLSLTSLGQLALQQRENAGYNTYIERTYRAILFVSAVGVMAMSSGLSFLRTDLSGLHLSSEQDSRDQGGSGQYWRFLVASSVGIIPVNWTSRIVCSVLGHFFKVTVTLMVLLFRRGEVLLACKLPGFACASGKLLDWIWSRDSHQAVMALLFVSTMAGDLSWRPEPSKSTTNRGTFIV